MRLWLNKRRGSRAFVFLAARPFFSGLKSPDGRVPAGAVIERARPAGESRVEWGLTIILEDSPVFG